MSMRQPWPTIFSPPITQSIGMKTSVPQIGTVGEGAPARQVPAADLDAGMVRRHQHHGNAEVLAATQQVLGVDDAHGKADQRSAFGASVM
jgi:hypothetical protein